MYKLIDYLCCVNCKKSLTDLGNSFVCSKCGRKYKFEDGIFDCMENEVGEKLFSQNKWDIFYNNWFKTNDIDAEYLKIEEMYQRYGTDQIKKYFNLKKNSVYFELGCGVFIIWTQVAKDCKLVVGIDFSLPALKAAKKILDFNGVKNYLLIRGDIFKIPIKDSSIDLLYGGGVIEHFKDTDSCISEYARIMKKN